VEGPLAEDGLAPALLYRMSLVTMIDSSRPSSGILTKMARGLPASHRPRSFSKPASPSGAFAIRNTTGSRLLPARGWLPAKVAAGSFGAGSPVGLETADARSNLHPFRDHSWVVVG
jgi:hypothetical protein